MKRRDFLKLSAPFGLMPILPKGLPINGLAATSPLLNNPCNVTDRCIVFVYLNGGNDIFNTTVPLNQFTDYANFRPDLYIQQSQLITLDTTLPSAKQMGLHPNLTGFKSLYDSGLLTIIQGVGYNNVNRSHFKGLDNWLTGSGGGEGYRTGWMGRFLNDRYPSFSGGPFIGELDPLGMLFGRMNNTGFHTNEEHSYEIIMSGKDSNGYYSEIAPVAGENILNIPDTEHGSLLSYIQNVGNSLNVYAARVQSTFNAGMNASSVIYPSSNLSNQLKTVAKMLSGGSRTKIFMTSIGGFDTHANQVDQMDSSIGFHTTLLDEVSSSVKAFQDDLAAQSLDDKVVTVIFSEFGRKIVQNGSYGIDHGTLGSIFVIGKGVDGGVIGDNVDLNNQNSQGSPDNSQMQYDYRQIYATLLQDWLGGDNTAIQNTFPHNTNNYATQKLPIFNTNNIVPSSCYYVPQVAVASAFLQVRIMLEGFYKVTSDDMDTNLGSSVIFPTSQPYHVAPFNYTGTESFTTLPPNTVDWVLIELRKAEDTSQVAIRKAVLVDKNGFLMQADGTPGVTFANVPEGDYHLAIFHRNHLGVMSSLPIVLDGGNYIYDFTLDTSKALGHHQLKQVGIGTYALYAGDMNNDGIINNQDYNYYQLNTGQNLGYKTADLNGDEHVDNIDYDLWYQNRSKLGEIK